MQATKGIYFLSFITKDFLGTLGISLPKPLTGGWLIDEWLCRISSAQRFPGCVIKINWRIGDLRLSLRPWSTVTWTRSDVLGHIHLLAENWSNLSESITSTHLTETFKIHTVRFEGFCSVASTIYRKSHIVSVENKMLQMGWRYAYIPRHISAKIYCSRNQVSM